MANITWIVDADGDWSTKADWSGGALPTSNDNVTINTLDIRTITHSTGNDFVHSLTVGNDQFDLTGGYLTIASTAKFANGFYQNGGDLLGAAAVTVDGVATMVGGYAGGSIAFTINGNIALANYTLGGSATLTNAATTNETGQITVGDDTGALATITNQSGATYNIGGDYGISAGATSAKFVNAGAIFKIAGDGTSFIDINLANTGAVTADTGLIEFRGADDTIGGTLAGAGQIAFGGGGDDMLSSGTKLSVAALGLYDNGTTLAIGANVAYSGSFAQGFGTTLDLAGYTLTLSGPVSFYNDDYATPTINGGGALDTSGATSINDFVLGGGVTWNNTGTVTQTAALQVGDGGTKAAILDNESGGTYAISNDTNIERGAAETSSIANAGTLTKSGGNGTSYVDIDLASTGTLTATSGTLYLRGPVDAIGGSLTGAGQIALGGSGTFTLSSGVAISVATFGIYDGGTSVTLGGNLAYAGNFVQAFSTTLDLAGHTLTLTGPVSLYNADYGTPTINGGGSIHTTGATSINDLTLGGGVTWNNNGTITQIGALQIGDSGTSAATLTNHGGATYAIANDSNIERGAAANSMFVNAGALSKTGGSGTSYIDVNLTSTGVLSAASGAMQFRDTATLGGTLSGAGQIAFGAGGNYTLSSGVKVSVSALALYDNGTMVTLGGNLSYSGSFSQGFGSTIDLAGHTLTLSGPVSFYNDDYATPTINGGGALDTSGATSINDFVLGGGVTWNNTGVITQTNTLQIGDGSGSAAVLDNQAGGKYDIADDTGIGRGTAASSSIINAGVLGKTDGTGTSTITVAIANSGSIVADSGLLDLQSGISGTGKLSIAGGALEADGAVAATQTATFGSSGGDLIVTNAAGFAADLSGFGAGDTLDLTGFSFSGGPKLSFVENANNTQGILTVTDGTLKTAIILLGQYAAAGFHTGQDSGSGTDITYVPPSPGHHSPVLAAAHG
jgi:hypothetical protein